MRVAIYPGSFNPFHEGHLDIIKKFLYNVDEVWLAIGKNSDKTGEFNLDLLNKFQERVPYYGVPVNRHSDKVKIHFFSGLFCDFVKAQMSWLSGKSGRHDVFVIKGLRNTNDFIYEQTQQYYNEDLGLTLPVYYVISDRAKVHISSSAIRALSKYERGK